MHPLGFLSEKYDEYLTSNSLDIAKLVKNQPSLLSDVFIDICNHVYADFKITQKTYYAELGLLYKEQKDPPFMEYPIHLEDEAVNEVASNVLHLPKQDFANIVHDGDVEEELERFENSPLAPLLQEIFVELGNFLANKTISPGNYLYCFCHFPHEVYADEDEKFTNAVAGFENEISSNPNSETKMLAKKIDALFQKNYPFFHLCFPRTSQFYEEEKLGEFSSCGSERTSENRSDSKPSIYASDSDEEDEEFGGKNETHYTMQLNLLNRSGWARKAKAKEVPIPDYIDEIPDGTGFWVRVETEAIAKGLADFCNVGEISWGNKLLVDELYILINWAIKLEIEGLEEHCSHFLGQTIREKKQITDQQKKTYEREVLDLIFQCKKKGFFLAAAACIEAINHPIAATYNPKQGKFKFTISGWDGCVANVLMKFLPLTDSLVFTHQQQEPEILYSLTDRHKEKEPWNSVKSLDISDCKAFDDGNLQTLFGFFPKIVCVAMGAHQNKLEYLRVLKQHKNLEILHSLNFDSSMRRNSLTQVKVFVVDGNTEESTEGRNSFSLNESNHSLDVRGHDEVTSITLPRSHDISPTGMEQLQSLFPKASLPVRATQTFLARDSRRRMSSSSDSRSFVKAKSEPNFNEHLGKTHKKNKGKSKSKNKS